MSNTNNFEIVNMYPGTDAQKKVGIYGTFELNVYIGGVHAITIADMKLRKTKDSEVFYVESSYGTYKDKQGVEKKRHSVRLFPQKENWDKQKIVTELALAALETAKNKPANRTQAQAAPQSSSSNDAW